MKSILFAFLLIIVPIVGNAADAEPGSAEYCANYKEQSECDVAKGCEWSAVGECWQCGANSYNDGNRCTACPDNYLSDAGSTVKSDCYMKCEPIKVENGSWEPDADKVPWGENNPQCEYKKVDNLTCTNYRASWRAGCSNTTETETETETETITDTINKCCVSEIPCADAWEHIMPTNIIKYKKEEDKSLVYLNSKNDIASLSDKASYDADTEKWNFTQCTGTGELYFGRNGKPVGKAGVQITGADNATWIININDDGKEACNKGNCCSGNTFCGKAQNGYYLTEKNTDEDTFLNNKCTPCPMGTTSETGADIVTKCHTTGDTRFVDNKGNSFSIADLFGGDIKLNVTQ